MDVTAQQPITPEASCYASRQIALVNAFATEAATQVDAATTIMAWLRDDIRAEVSGSDVGGTLTNWAEAITFVMDGLHKQRDELLAVIKHAQRENAGAEQADAALIAVCEQCCQLEARWRALDGEAIDAFAASELTPARNAVLNAGLATTAAGLAAKARVLVAFYDDEWPSDTIFDGVLREVVSGLAEQVRPVAEAVL